MWLAAKDTSTWGGAQTARLEAYAIRWPFDTAPKTISCGDQPRLLHSLSLPYEDERRNREILCVPQDRSNRDLTSSSSKVVSQKWTGCILKLQRKVTLTSNMLSSPHNLILKGNTTMVQPPSTPFHLILAPL